MRTVKLFGELGRKFGKIHKFAVSSPAEAIRALCANFPEFERELQTSHTRNIGYQVFNGSYELQSEIEVGDPASGDIRIIPAIMGANATARILVGAALVAGGVYFAQPWMVAAGASLALGGIVELMSPVPKVKEPDERPENKPSYLFNGPVNTTAQGHPVPVGYGRLRIGGGIVSAGISIDQIMAGFRRVTRIATANRTFNDTDNVWLGAQPVWWNKYYRKELVSKSKVDGDWLVVYKFYYYETVLEPVEV